MKLKIEIDVPTASMIEAELRKVLDNLNRDSGKVTFLAVDQTEFTNTTITVTDSNNQPYMVGIDPAPENSTEEGMNIQVIKYCSTEKEAHEVVERHPNSDIYDLFVPIRTVYGKENL